MTYMYNLRKKKIFNFPFSKIANQKCVGRRSEVVLTLSFILLFRLDICLVSISYETTFLTILGHPASMNESDLCSIA